MSSDGKFQELIDPPELFSQHQALEPHKTNARYMLWYMNVYDRLFFFIGF